MRRLAVILSVVVAFSGLAWGTTVYVPDATVRPGDTTLSITIPINFTSPTDINTYEYYLQIAGEGSATGVTFKTPNNATVSPTNYVFPTDDDFGISNYNASSNSSHVYFADNLADFTNVTYDANQTKNSAVVTFNVGTVHVGDKFQVTFNPAASNLYSWDSGSFMNLPIDGITFQGGTITVVPEPASMCLVGLGAVALLRRHFRRSRTRA